MTCHLLKYLTTLPLLLVVLRHMLLTGIGQSSPLSPLSLDYVLFVPSCPVNLISINKFTCSLSCSITFTSDSLYTCPMDHIVKFLPDQGEPYPNPGRYWRLVGKLNNLTLTGPDISFPFSIVSQFLNSPCVSHWNAVVRILKYIKKAPEKGLVFTNRGHTSIVGFSDVIGKEMQVISGLLLVLYFSGCKSDFWKIFWKSDFSGKDKTYRSRLSFHSGNSLWSYQNFFCQFQRSTCSYFHQNSMGSSNNLHMWQDGCIWYLCSTLRGSVEILMIIVLRYVSILYD